MVWFHADHVPHGFSGGRLVAASNSRIVRVVRAYGDNAIDAAVPGYRVADGMGLEALTYGDFLRRNRIDLPTGPPAPAHGPRAALVRIVYFLK